jgi:hypothetical protein
MDMIPWSFELGLDQYFSFMVMVKTTFVLDIYKEISTYEKQKLAFPFQQ